MSKILGQALRSAREANGLTQQQVADALGVTRAAVGQWEKGTTEPATENLLQVCSFLNLNMAAATGGMVQIKTLPTLRDPEESFRMVSDRRPEQRHLQDELIRFLDANPSTRETARVVPVYASTHGGVDADFYRTDEIVDFVKLPPSWRTFKGSIKIYGLYVTSSVLAPRFEIGELIYVTAIRPVSPGGYALIRLKGDMHGEATRWILRKVVERNSTAWTVQTFNPARQDEITVDQVDEVHRVMDWGELVDP